jgi:integrase
VQGNRQISYLKSAWNWGEERYDIPGNPCLGVKPNKERPRDRYVSHLEYEKALSLAPEWLQIAMGLAYWCRARRAEVLAMTYEDVTEDGLIVNRLKNSMSEITVSEQVADLVVRSRSLSEGSNHLVRNTRGKPVREAGFNSAWRRLAVRMGDDHFHFHDLKAKGISDMKNEQWAGHKTKKALAVYQRRMCKVYPDYD